ncbi:hypothetical protein GH733_002564 [Mirounga leonina]|nr:hypothetical protein GH733_002564 [Mirounga leonina]
MSWKDLFAFMLSLDTSYTEEMLDPKKGINKKMDRRREAMVLCQVLTESVVLLHSQTKSGEENDALAFTPTGLGDLVIGFSYKPLKKGCGKQKLQASSTFRKAPHDLTKQRLREWKSWAAGPILAVATRWRRLLAAQRTTAPGAETARRPKAKGKALRHCAES